MVEKELRVGIISFDYEPPLGGQGIYVIGLRNLLKNIKNIELYILASSTNRNPNESMLPRINNEKISPILFSLLINIFGMKWAKNNNIDVIHLQCGAGGVFWIRNNKDIPIVATSHLLYSKKYEINKNFVYKLLMLLERNTYKKAKRIVATSDVMKKELINRYGLKSSSIEIISPSIDTNFYQNSNKVKKNNRELLFVGRLDPNKRVDRLVEIVAKIKIAVPNIKLTIVGVGSESTHIQENINKLQASNYIKMLGHKDKIKLRKLYSRAAITILPSKYEAFGITAIESLACGTQVIVPANSGLAQQIYKNEWGYVFTDLDDLERVIKIAINNPKNINFSEIENEFSNDVALKKIINLYS
jgi:glycosyltransferase involved in cell wall biosynthesis